MDAARTKGNAPYIRSFGQKLRHANADIRTLRQNLEIARNADYLSERERERLRGIISTIRGVENELAEFSGHIKAVADAIGNAPG